MPLGYRFPRSVGLSPPGSLTQPNPETFLARLGRAYGHGHLAAGMNNQDTGILQALTIGAKHYLIGLVSDGCSTQEKKKSRNEICSALLTKYALMEIRNQLMLGVPPAEIPAVLYPRCVSYIGSIARLTVGGQPEEVAEFVQNFLLGTLSGFVMDDENLVVFLSGDGFYLLNEEDCIIDQKNAPLYMGYHHIARHLLPAGTKLPDGFQVRVFDLQYIQHFALGTDGLIKRTKEKGEYIDPDERRAIFSHKRSALAGLQWWMNVANSEKFRFDDDATIITIESPEGAALIPARPDDFELFGEPSGGTT